MALIFDDHIFYHIPKTGGNYVRKVIGEVCHCPFEIGHNHNTPLEIEGYHKHKSFTTVRHPLGWYESYYRYRMTKGWRQNHFIDQHCTSGNFEDFVNGMLKAYPCGYVTARYLSVIPFVDHVLRMENLNNELNLLLTKWGYSLPTDVSPTNVTSKKINTSISSDAMSRLLRAESRIIKHLNY